MDVQKLNYLKHWLEYSSFTLSLENYIILTNSLLLLQSENHFKKVLFWGVIQGLESDYFISFGYEKDAITGRKYFYSENCQNWKLLPVPQQKHLVLTELCRRPFQGDPGFVVEVVDDAPPDDLFPDQSKSVIGVTEASSTIQYKSKEPTGSKAEEGTDDDENDEEGEKKSKISSKKSVGHDTAKSEASAVTSGELKEEDRLAAIIQIITDETAITPRGGIFRQIDGISVHSRAFEGIKIDDADSLCSFQHYRVPLNDYNTNLLIRCDYNYAIDFLDTIDKDIPADCWLAQLVEGDRTLILRNLHWPGYMFFHYLNSPDHGFIYLGEGYRNLDIPFMTQVMLPTKPLEEEEEIPGGEEKELAQSTGGGEPRPSKLSRQSTTSNITKTGTKLDTKMKSQLGTKLESKLDSKLGSQLGTKLESKSDNKLGTQLGTKLGTKVATRLSQLNGNEEIDLE